MSKPTPAFWRGIAEIHKKARARLVADGHRILGFECIFDPEDSKDWLDLRSIHTIYEDDGVERRVKTPVDAHKLNRPIRKTKKKVRPVRKVRSTNRFVGVEVREARCLTIRKEQLPPKSLQEIKKAFTYKNPDYTKKKRLGKWLGKTPKEIKNYSDPEDGPLLFLPRGGKRKLAKVLKRYGTDIRIIQDLCRPDPVEWPLGESAKLLTMEPDQEMLIQRIEEEKNCLIRSGTASGKTETCLEFMRRKRLPSLVVVWQSGLMKGEDGWMDRICQRYGWRPEQIGQIGDGKKTIGDQVTVAMAQTLRNMDPDVLDRFGIVVADEVQRFAARTLRETIGYFSSEYLIGVSADEKRKDRMECLTYDAFGEVAAEISKEELEAKGRVCEVEIIIIPTGFVWEAFEEVEPENQARFLSQNWNDLLDELAADEDRNRLILGTAKSCVDEDRTSIIFVNRKEHAWSMQKAFQETYDLDCGACVGGKENEDELEYYCRALTKGTIPIAVGTSCMYQARNIPRLADGLCTIPMGTNKQLLEQMVGRLRRKFKGKGRGRLFYFWDENLFPSHPDNIRRWYKKGLVKIMD